MTGEDVNCPTHPLLPCLLSAIPPQAFGLPLLSHSAQKEPQDSRAAKVQGDHHMQGLGCN